MAFVIKQGDNRPYLTELLFDGAKKYVDPTALTVKFNMAQKSTNIIDHGTAYVVAVTLDTATATSLATSGYVDADGDPMSAGSYVGVEYRWEDPAATGTAGDMSYEWETTDVDDGILTFPSGSNNSLTIAAQVK